MPKITQVNQIEVSPEKFLGACSDEELYETFLLLGTAIYQDRIDRMAGIKPKSMKLDQIDNNQDAY